MRGFPGQHTLPYSAHWAQNLLCRPRDQKHPDRNFNFQINAEVLRVLRLKLSCIFSVEPHRTGHPLYQQSRNCSVTLPSIINQNSALIHTHLIQSATCAFEYLLIKKNGCSCSVLSHQIYFRLVLFLKYPRACGILRFTLILGTYKEYPSKSVLTRNKRQ